MQELGCVIGLDSGKREGFCLVGSLCQELLSP